MKNVLLFIFLLLSSTIFAQIISISYKNPQVSSLCDTISFEVTLKNSDTKIAKETQVYLELPKGISYLKGSVQNATEKTLTSAQIFDFEFGDINSNSTKSLIFKAFINCDALVELNKGALFSNVIIARYGVNEVATLTEPYTIESPLPIIVAVTDPYMKAGKGEMLERIFTIENTRKGQLRSFRFEDNHDGGMIVSANIGKGILNNLKQNHIVLDGSDFQKIGDGDVFFEEGEQIIIKEKILITDCGDLVPKSTSKINIVWGCSSAPCQTERFTAVVDILRSNASPNVELFPSVQSPSDYCGKDGVNHNIIIKNTGKDTAYNVVLKLQRINIMTFMDRNSYILKDKNGLKKLIPFSFVAKPMSDCAPQNTQTDSIALFQLPTLAPNESYEFLSQYLTCNPSCSENTPEWRDSIFYEKSCPKKELVKKGLQVTVTPFSPFGSSNIGKFRAYKNGETFTYGYGLEPQDMKDSIAAIDVEFTLPCGFSWVGGAMTLGNTTASNFSQTNLPNNETLVKMTFFFQNGVKDSLGGTYQLRFDCNATCSPEQPFYTNLISSCSNQCIDSIAYFTGSKKVSNNVLFKLKGIKGCGIKSCNTYAVYFDCTKSILKSDTVQGYALSNILFERVSLGTPDNDNNRLEDNGGAKIDLTKIRRDHFFPNDTAFFEVKSVIRAEKIGSTFKNAKVEVKFEWHLADVSKIYGLPTTSAENFYPLNLDLKIYSKKLNKTFNCVLPNPKTSKYEQPFPYINVLPPLMIDQIRTLEYEYVLNTSTVACLPNNFLFEEGDSVIVNGLYLMDDNPRDNIMKKIAAINSYRVKAGTSVFNDEKDISNDFYCRCTEKRFHVAGFGLLQSKPKIPLLDCYPTVNSTYSFSFGPSKIYPNFFPYEIRSIGKVPEVVLEIGEPSILKNIAIKTWKILDGVTTSSNQNVDYTIDPSNKKYILNLLPFQNPRQDEGFEATFDLTFESSCLNKIQDNFNTSYSVVPDNAASPKESVKYIFPVGKTDTIFSLNYNRLIVNNLYEEYNSFDNTAVWELEYNNPSKFTTPNPYLYFSNAKGLSDVKVILKSDGSEIKPKNGLYNLPEVKPNDVYNVQIFAINNTCDEAKIDVFYGWNCTPLSDTIAKSCSEKKYTLYVSPTPGEVELSVTSPKDTNQMCAPTDYAFIEVASVRFGSVFNPTLKLTLPAGLSIQSGSCQIAYPAASGNFVNIADPTNGTWNLADLIAKIKQNGLAGISQKPNNKALIRFKFTTECGFLAGKNFSAKVEGFEICGKKTNELTRAGKPIFLQGVTPIYATNIQVKPIQKSLRCDQESLISIRAITKGTTGNKDSLYVFIPKNVQYLSYDIENNNSPKTGPDIQIVGNQQLLKWKIPAGLGPGVYIGIVLHTKGWGTNDCKDDILKIKTIQRQETTCISDGKPCSNVYVTGESNDLTIDVNHPVFDIEKASVDVNDNQVSFSLNVKNLTSADTIFGINVDLYFDKNGNKKFDAGIDELLGSQNFNEAFGANGKIKTLNGLISTTLSSEKICNLLLVIDEKKNCACQNIFIPIEKIKWNKADLQVCSGEKTSLGVAPLNHFYQWNPPTNLSCSNCANPIFNYNNDSDKNVTFSYQFLDTIPKCYVDYKINVVVSPKLKISASKTGICKGESIVLTASNGISYNWTGNGIVNATSQNQTLSPSQTSFYKVTVTTAKCSGIDSFLVKVGGGKGAKKDTICEGEKITIENATFTKTGSYEIKYKVGVNCDSIFTLQLTVLPKPTIDAPLLITVKEGESQNIVFDGKNYTFLWTPNVYLSCSNCPNPIVKPEKDTLYTISFTDKNGCANTRALSVKIAPNCDIAIIQPVSVFMPDGDIQDNKNFRFYGLEGRAAVTISVKIFNRWGEKVFELLDHPDPQWDGFFNQKTATTDVYIVLYKIDCAENKGEWKKINVSLLR